MSSDSDETSEELGHDCQSAWNTLSATSVLESRVYSRLPVELVRKILVTVANEDHYSALKLCLTSRSVYLWLHPIAYLTIIVGDVTGSRGDGEPAERFNECLDNTVIMDWRTPSHANGPIDVRNIHFYPTGDDPEEYEPIYYDILTKCPRIRRLILPLEAHHHLENRTWPKPWEIMTLMYHGDEWIVPNIHPIMFNVTHLYLTVGHESEDESDPQSLLEACLALPNLTHLAREYDSSCMILPNSLLRQKPSLQMLFIFVDIEPNSRWSIPPAIFADFKQITDPRLFVGLGFSEESQHGFLEEGESLWDKVTEGYSDWRTVTRGPLDPLVRGPQ